jgi:hypothetical protein
MKDFQKTKNVMTISIALAVVSFTIYGFLFWDIKVKNEQISSLVNDANQFSNKDHALRLVKISLEQNKNLIDQLDSYFIPSDGVVGFISSIESLGKESGVELVVTSVETLSDPKNTKDFKEALHLRLETMGSWKGTFYFLSVLENLPYQVDVSQVTFGLTGATDKVAFDSSPGAIARTRQPSKEERWHGTYDVTVLKLK